MDHHHAGRVEAALSAGGAARSALVASWQRSASLHHLRPGEHRPPNRVDDRTLSRHREGSSHLLSVVQPNLDHLYAAVGNSGCCVLLADKDGILIERRGAIADDETFEGWGLWTGTVWDERSEGTNGIGTCLAEGRALTVYRDEHFFTRNIGLSCTTAPIHDEHGQLIAALDVSSCRNDLTRDVMRLIAMAVTDAARRIETENFRRAFSKARIVIVGEESSLGPARLIAVDQDDLVIGATRAARQFLSLSSEQMRIPLPASDLLADRRDLAQSGLEKAERSALQRALARAGGNVSAAASQLGISRATLHRKMKRLALRHRVP
ncbi:GAF domain-containing protein [Limoniibacter endophyticus]|uniref:Transcriptional regulator n=1 Tax=Limoniibacter endophyticus TaxID=1565040 RepID=A0A8J3GH87_9HYPH|nr:helix-turn-helix domain-containing protein [Limoniibacter endophyticus]GHC70479.1 transcriptional regulator [Limoniibacter endophyticus]